MKFLSAFLVAAATVATVPTIAMAKDCGARPAKLSLPDGATATEDQMKATQAKLAPYAQAMNTYLQCLSAEIKSGTEEYKGVADQWTVETKKFKDTPAK